MGGDLEQSLYALDSTTIDLCLALFPWARFRRRKAAVKMHTLLDLRGNIPTFIRVTEGKVHDVNMLDEIVPEAGAFYVMDRAYIDFERLFLLTLNSAFFVVRTKSNVLLQRRYSHPVDKSTGVRSDHTVILTAINSVKVYPDALRRVTYVDPETNKRFRFLTNNFVLPALTIARIYKSRWQVELFFESSTWCTPSDVKDFKGQLFRIIRWWGRGSASVGNATLDVSFAQNPGCANAGLRCVKLFVLNQPQHGCRRDAEDNGDLADRHFVASLALPLTVDGNLMVLPQ